MKIQSFLVLGFAALSLASCDITREISLNEDGSGKISNTIDLSSMIGLAKMAGQGKEMDEVGKKNIDTTVSLQKMVDSITGLTPEEKALAKKGTLDFKMNLEEEKFITTTKFPFSNTDQLSKLSSLANKAIQDVVKKQLDKGEGAENMPPGMGDEMPTGSLDEYFTTTYGKNFIEKKLIADKYAKADDDKALQSLKEVSAQGLSSKTTIIINLPRPAKKTTGKNVTLSEDKKKVTISEPLDDFFDDGKNLEFRIDY